MTRRVVMDFQGPGGYGFQEVFYYNGPTSDPDFTTNISGLATARLGLSAKDVNLIHLRVDSSVPRAPYVFILEGGGSPGTATTPAAPEEVGLLMRIVALADTPFYNRPWIRGIPIDAILEDNYHPLPYYEDAVNYFSTFLADGPFRVVGSLTATPADIIDISTLTPTPPRGFTAIGPVTTIVAGNTVRIRGSQQPGYNGLKTVLRVSASGLTYSFGGAAPAAPDPTSATSMQLQSVFDLPIKRAFVEKLSTRKAGRPFGLIRGRRPTLFSLRR